MEIIGFYESRFIRNLKKNKYQYSEEFAVSILKDKKLLRKTVIVIGSLMFIQTNAYATGDISVAVDGINKAGSTLLTLVQNFGYWGCLLCCALEVLKDLMAQNTRDIGKTIGKYAVAFGTFYFLPWIFDVIKVCFGN